MLKLAHQPARPFLRRLQLERKLARSRPHPRKKQSLGGERMLCVAELADNIVHLRAMPKVGSHSIGSILFLEVGQLLLESSGFRPVKRHVLLEQRHVLILCDFLLFERSKFLNHLSQKTGTRRDRSERHADEHGGRSEGGGRRLEGEEGGRLLERHADGHGRRSEGRGRRLDGGRLLDGGRQQARTRPARAALKVDGGRRSCCIQQQMGISRVNSQRSNRGCNKLTHDNMARENK